MIHYNTFRKLFNENMVCAGAVEGFTDACQDCFYQLHRLNRIKPNETDKRETVAVHCRVKWVKMVLGLLMELYPGVLAVVM